MSTLPAPTKYKVLTTNQSWRFGESRVPEERTTLDWGGRAQVYDDGDEVGSNQTMHVATGQTDGCRSPRNENTRRDKLTTGSYSS
jgi:hypothetical protein